MPSNGDRTAVVVGVPIENIYYLLCYAWDYELEARTVDVGSKAFNGPLDLFAFVLTKGVSRLVSRGLDRDYIPVQEDIRGLKGKLELAATINKCLLLSGKVRCSFDELSYDVPQNQILKATLWCLSLNGSLNSETRTRAKRLYQKLDAVSDVLLTSNQFKKVQLHRNNRIYGLLIDVCQLIYQNLLATEENSDWRFPNFAMPSEQAMGYLFEKFVRRFCQRETDSVRYSVHDCNLKWIGVDDMASDHPILPKMKTDLVLRSDERTIIVDTKFYSSPLTSNNKAHSEHLYQIFAYVKNWRTESVCEPEPEGWLLYAAVDKRFDYSFVLGGRKFRACSIDLNQHWNDIKGDLVNLVREDPDRFLNQPYSSLQ